jgi:WD40 repeat protein
LLSLKPAEDHYVSYDSLAFSMDGTVLAAGTQDKTILLWNLPDGTISRSLQGFEAGVGLIQFSPDGKLMLSGLWFGGPLRLWETGDYNLYKLITNPQTDYGTAAFSQDGSILGAYTHLGGLQFWRVKDGKEIGLWEINQHITSLAFSPDGSRVATGTNHGNIKLWSYPEGKLLQEYNGHSGDIVGLIFSSDGKVLYSGSWDGTAYLWELP